MRSRQQQSSERPVFRVVGSASEAEEHLRVIRQAMERSTKHSTLSGPSGVVVGLIALAACLLTQYVVTSSPEPLRKYLFVSVWALSLLLAVAADVLFTKRRAVRVGKTAFSPLGRHLTRAAAPGFAACLVLTLFNVAHPDLPDHYLYGVWMLCYAASLLSVGMFSVREVSLLGWAFLGAGALTLLLPPGAFLAPRAMMAITFGGFHIAYGIWMGRKYGW